MQVAAHILIYKNIELQLYKNWTNILHLSELSELKV